MEKPPEKHAHTLLEFNDIMNIQHFSASQHDDPAFYGLVLFRSKHFQVLIRNLFLKLEQTFHLLTKWHILYTVSVVYLLFLVQFN